MGPDRGLCWVRYFSDEVYHEEILTSFPVMSRRTVDRHTGDAPFTPAGTFGWTHGVVDLPSRNEYRLRFYEDNRYRILDPYTSLPNDPWYPRIQREAHAGRVGVAMSGLRQQLRIRYDVNGIGSETRTGIPGRAGWFWIRFLFLKIQSQVIAWSIGEILSNSEISFCCLNR